MKNLEICQKRWNFKKALDSRNKAASIESDAAMAKMLTQYETEKKKPG